MQSFLVYCLSISLTLTLTWLQLTKTAYQEWESPFALDIKRNGLKAEQNFGLPFLSVRSAKTLTVGSSPIENEDVLINRRKRRAVNGLEQNAPCYTMGGGMGMGGGDYDVLGERRKAKAKAKSSKKIDSTVQSIKNKFKKKKLVADGEDADSVRRRRRQVEQENISSDVGAKMKELLERVSNVWSSFVDSMREVSKNVAERFKSTGESVVA